MKIFCLSDLHGHLPEVPECDVVAISGDIVNGFKQRGADARAFLTGPFSTWADEVPAKNIIVCAGNHDFWAMESNLPLPVMSEKITFLQDSGTEIDGVNFWGTPWQPPFGWAFNVDDKYAHVYYDQIPENTDVLLSHSPPYSYCDMVWEYKSRGKSVGSKPLLQQLARLKDLELLVCGHIHSGHGTAVTHHGITVVNAAVVDYDYRLARPGVMYESTDR